MAYTIEITSVTRRELLALPAHIKRSVSDAIDIQLTHTPLTLTRNRKRLRDEVKANFHFVPPLWEFRVGEAGYRIFYDVDDAARIVYVRSVR